MFTLISTTIRRFVVFLSDVSFRKWIFIFGILGLVVPALYVLPFLIFRAHMGTVAVMFSWWPTSRLLMGLDTPNPSTAAFLFFYALAVLGNVVLYAVFGILSWPILFLLRLACRPPHE